MAKRLLSDDIWESIEPLLPTRPAKPKGGRPVIEDRDVLTGILFMLKTGIAWEDLPSEMGCGCGMTCLRRLREWQQVGVWPTMQNILETRLPEANRIDWSRVTGRSEIGQSEAYEQASSSKERLQPQWAQVSTQNQTESISRLTPSAQ